MRKLILLIVLVVIVLAVVYRDRLFLRDPLGKVERNGIAVPGARVFINFENDTLVQEDGGRRMFLVQNYNRLPASPQGLTCLQGLLCVTPSDQAVTGAADNLHQARMSDREVSFPEASGDQVLVVIR